MSEINVVITEVKATNWSAVVVKVSESNFAVSWTDGINMWDERYDDLAVAFARLAALVRAADAGTYLVHQWDAIEGTPAFEREAERFISRTVHASSCQVGCDGTDPANHEV